MATVAFDNKVTVEDFRTRVMLEGLEGAIDYYNPKDIEDEILRRHITNADAALTRLENYLDSQELADARGY
jgi:hypothetical protein